MKNKVRAAAIIVSLTFLSTSAQAQAFGIEMGTSLENLTVTRDVGDGDYTIEVPKAHPEFEFYAVTLTPETGVCRVIGIGKPHENDGFGESVRMAFGNLRKALENNYGKHHFSDYIKTGALWDSSEEWTMSIRQNERKYHAIWDNEEASDIPDNLEEIILRVSARSSDSAYIGIRYTFSNFDKCNEILTRANNSGL